jgi:hypothetical protein
MASLIERIFAIVAADPRWRTIQELKGELESTIRDKRLLALVRIRRQMERSGLRTSYFSLAEHLTLNDPDSTCRWQATIFIGEFIGTQPDRVWCFARAMEQSVKADIRMAAATVLLEHLLQHYPARMGSLFEKELRTENRRLASAISSCGNFGDTNGAKRRIQRVIELAKQQSNTGMQPTAQKARHGWCPARWADKPKEMR